MRTEYLLFMMVCSLIYLCLQCTRDFSRLRKLKTIFIAVRKVCYLLTRYRKEGGECELIIVFNCKQSSSNSPK